MTDRGVVQPAESYSPSRRTALVLSGTGTGQFLVLQQIPKDRLLCGKRRV